MNGPGILELVVIVFLLWVLLGPQKVMEGARVLGKAYRQFRDHGANLRSSKVTEKGRVRASAERLRNDTSDMDIKNIKLVMIGRLSKE